MVEWDRNARTINNLETIIEVNEEEEWKETTGADEWLSARILCNVNQQVKGNREESELDSEKETERILKKFPQILFTNEKEATKTHLVECELWVKDPIPVRYKP